MSYIDNICMGFSICSYGVLMQVRKTMNLPKELLEAAVKATGATNQTMAVIIALQEVVRKMELAELKKYKGKVNLDGKSISENRRR